MNSRQTKNRRHHERRTYSTDLHFHHPTSNQYFPCRSVDVSTGGMLLRIPARSPVQVGNAIQLHVEPMGQPEWAINKYWSVPAKIVRIDRAPLLTDGHVSIGVQFAYEQDFAAG